MLTRIICTLRRHPIRYQPDPPGEHTLMVFCPCAKVGWWIEDGRLDRRV